MQAVPTKSETPAVRLRQLTKKIRGKNIADSLSFDIQKGEIFGFLGPNGAGKTTTIRMIVGLRFNEFNVQPEEAPDELLRTGAWSSIRSIARSAGEGNTFR